MHGLGVFHMDDRADLHIVGELKPVLLRPISSVIYKEP